MRPTRRFAGVMVLAAATLIAVGAAGALAVAGASAPTQLTSSEPTAAINIDIRAFADTRRVAAMVRVHPGEPLAAPAAGVVTRVTCAPGSEWTSGDLPMSVDGRAILTLHTSTPLYRDLVRGDQGDDVAAVEQALVALGHEVVVDGLYGASTAAAVDRLLGDTEGGLPITRVIWLPEPRVQVASCPAALGSRVLVGQAVAITSSVAWALEIAALPTDALDGARSISVDGVTFGLQAGSSVVDPDLLGELSQAPSIRAAVESGQDSQVVVDLVLTTPVLGALVPPSAIVVDSETPCVLDDDGSPHSVRVLGVSLGSSLIAFDGSPPARVLISPGERGCG